MKTSARGVAAIATHEGVVTKAYRDVGGVWTIGVGHTASAGEPRPVAGMTITLQEALDILARDIARFEKRVDATFPRGLPQHAYDGAVSFDFNVGEIHAASWPKSYKAGNMPDAERRLKLYNKAGGRTVLGLVRRREAEADLIFRGKYPDGVSVIGIGPVSSPTYSDPETIRGYQMQLAALRYDPGSADGVRGPRTRAALVAFQAANDLVADGIYGPATKATLDRVHGERFGAGPDDPDPKHPDVDDVDEPPEAPLPSEKSVVTFGDIAIVLGFVAAGIFGLLKLLGVV
jgi:lysozyme